MIHAADSNANAAAAPAQHVPASEEDAAAFARELGDRLGGDPTQRAVSHTLGRLAGLFPAAAITAEASASVGAVVRHAVRIDAETTVNLEPEVLARMSRDEELFRKVADMITALSAAAKSQNLVDVGASASHRAINITSLEIRYVEVQRGGDGAFMSVSSLLFQANQTIADALDTMLAAGRDSQSSSWSFSAFVSRSASWRFESQLSSAGLAGMLQVRQNMTASIDILIETWTLTGKVDLVGYMEIMGLVDPLVFDLGGEGINLSSAENGVYFDIMGDGSPVRTAFIQGDNAFLYLDKNGNGVVDDVSELFGDHGGFANGFANLAQYDDNGDGIIDENDAIFSQLRLWSDRNGDGINQIEESMTLAEAGIKSINLNHDNNRSLDAHGNVIGERSTFTRTDGSQGLLADVWLRHR